MHMVLVCDAMKMGNCANCIPIDINGKTLNNPLTLTRNGNKLLKLLQCAIAMLRYRNSMNTTSLLRTVLVFGVMTSNFSKIN